MLTRAEATALYPEPVLLHGGEPMQAKGHAMFPVVDPATGTTLAEFPVASERDVDECLRLTQQGFALWSATPVTERSAVLNRAADLILADRARLAALVTLELGKPTAEALTEADTAAGMFRWAAEEARRLYGRQIPGRESDCWQMSFLEPVGPVAAFAAWNAPLITPARKISSTLAAGCSVILKAAEETPACAVELARLVVKAGVPEGAVSVLFGDPAMISARLLASPVIRAVTFTGSTTIGKLLSAQACQTMKRLVMELGGHAPVLVFDDIDIEAVAKAAATAKFRNSGQVCTAPTRFLVQRKIYEPFAEALAAAARALSVGDGFDAATQMGPMALERRRTATEALVADARDRGLRILAGGSRIDRPGIFHEPTVIADAGTDAKVSNEEPFGPIAALTQFDTLDEAVGIANRLPIGLAAYVMTNRLDLAKAAARRIEAGTVSVNGWRASLPETPFGGLKESGVGREGGLEGVLAFTNIKHVALM